MGGNCRSTRSLPLTLPPATRIENTHKSSQKAPIQPNQLEGDTGSLHSDISDSSGISTGSSASGYSNRSSSSGTSSGYYSSGGSTSPPPPPSPPPTPTDFAGLPNMGNTCYMNAVLQIIAALYPDEVQEQNINYLENSNNAINNGHYPLNPDKVQGFISSFPEKAKNIATSGQQYDPDEFIMALGGAELLHHICYTESFLCKRKRGDEQVLYKKESPKQPEYGLQVSLNRESITKLSLSDMIASGREELVDDEGISIDSWDSYKPYTGTKSSFLKEKESQLTPQEGNRLKQYIKQQVINKLPDKLYIQLKRYTNHNTKIEDLVHGTMEITIKPDPNKEDTVRFALEGFILHKGTTTGGHYIAYVKRNGKWYEANDSSIKTTEQTDVIDASKEAYLLFYRKKQ
ncbi:ubiquitin carboxyl-terminal hydrolase family protein [Cardinium endosymbiont of Philonthus spinipes]|uniref:ubiquitin carboxyl-terminal hydrolase family protein n=1 Tax=Cardinium endosymbiont of Philonthus spinipes TaxID=3077941 RepID=UPI00313E7B17